MDCVIPTSDPSVWSWTLSRSPSESHHRTDVDHHSTRNGNINTENNHPNDNCGGRFDEFHSDRDKSHNDHRDMKNDVENRCADNALPQPPLNQCYSYPDQHQIQQHRRRRKGRGNASGHSLLTSVPSFDNGAVAPNHYTTRRCFSILSNWVSSSASLLSPRRSQPQLKPPRKQRRQATQWDSPIKSIAARLYHRAASGDHWCSKKDSRIMSKSNGPPATGIATGATTAQGSHGSNCSISPLEAVRDDHGSNRDACFHEFLVNVIIPLLVLLDMLAVALVVPLLFAYYRDTAHVTSSTMREWLQSIFAMSQIGGGMMSATLIRTTPRNLLLISFAGSFISYFLLLIPSGNIYTVVMSRVLVGVVKQTMTVCTSLVTQYTSTKSHTYSASTSMGDHHSTEPHQHGHSRHRRTRALGRIQAASTTAWVIGPTLGGILYRHFGLVAPGLVACALFAVNMLLALWFIPTATVNRTIHGSDGTASSSNRLSVDTDRNIGPCHVTNSQRTLSTDDESIGSNLSRTTHLARPIHAESTMTTSSETSDSCLEDTSSLARASDTRRKRSKPKNVSMHTCDHVNAKAAEVDEADAEMEDEDTDTDIDHQLLLSQRLLTELPRRNQECGNTDTSSHVWRNVRDCFLSPTLASIVGAQLVYTWVTRATNYSQLGQFYEDMYGLATYQRGYITSYQTVWALLIQSFGVRPVLQFFGGAHPPSTSGVQKNASTTIFTSNTVESTLTIQHEVKTVLWLVLIMAIVTLSEAMFRHLWFFLLVVAPIMSLCNSVVSLQLQSLVTHLVPVDTIFNVLAALDVLQNAASVTTPFYRTALFHFLNKYFPNPLTHDARMNNDPDPVAWVFSSAIHWLLATIIIFGFFHRLLVNNTRSEANLVKMR